LRARFESDHGALRDFQLISWRYLGHQPQKLLLRALRKLAIALGFTIHEGMRRTRCAPGSERNLRPRQRGKISKTCSDPQFSHFALASQWSGIGRERLPNPAPLSAIVIL
jgi:hypothetical protein